MQILTITLGPGPWGEDNAQVGTEGYGIWAMAECRAWQRQLKRHYQTSHQQDLPKGCRLQMAERDHDFGPYYEIEVAFDVEDKAQAEAAFWLEKHMPERWDGDARAELELPDEE